MTQGSKEAVSERRSPDTDSKGKKLQKSTEEELKKERGRGITSCNAEGLSI